MQVIIFSSPSRIEMLEALKEELKGFKIKVIDDPKTFGKRLFWQRWYYARLYCLASKEDDYLILPDDVTDLDLNRIKEIFIEKKNKLFTCNVTNDGRKSCWGGDYFDCGGLTNRATLSKLTVTQPAEQYFNTHISSGVGYQLTMQLRKMGAELITPAHSLCNHGDHDSVMHYEERKRTPLIAKRPMKIVVGMATFKGREQAVEMAINSLSSQVDEIILYDNEVNPDIADNGKFYGLTMQKQPCYYFTCDDDLIYPPDYISKMIEAIDRLGTIVTHHGRVLLGLDVSYYRGHKTYRCLDSVNEERLVDVCGTGVTGFRTDYFNPVSLYKNKDKRMSDIIFSLEAVKQGKSIHVLKHSKGWIKQINVPLSTSIHTTEHKKEQRQIQLANKIYNAKNN